MAAPTPKFDLPNVSVHQLLYVREAARAGTWTEAARRLGVSQPALSQGVAEVERRLGVTLFTRTTRQRTPTAALPAVLAMAEVVIASVADLDRHLAQLEAGSRGTLRVGMIDTAALGALSEPLAEFRARHPDVDTTLVVEPSVGLAQRVAAGELDLAVVVVPNAVVDEKLGRFHVTPLLDEPVHVYAPTRALARRPPGAWGPWVAYPAGSQSRRLIERALAARGADVVIVAESSNPDVLRQMVRLGVGWCALPKDIAGAGLAQVPGPPLLYRRLALIRRAESAPHGAAAAFAEMLGQSVGRPVRPSSRRPR